MYRFRADLAKNSKFAFYKNFWYNYYRNIDRELDQNND